MISQIRPQAMKREMPGGLTAATTPVRSRNCPDRNRGRTLRTSRVIEELEDRRLLADTLGFDAQLGNNYTTGWGSTMAVDAKGNTYLAGSFHGTVDFNAGHSRKTVSVSRNESNDIFLAKYDSQGILIWNRQYGGPKSDRATTLKLASNGDIFLAGIFEDVAQFGTAKEPLRLTSNGKVDAFIARIDATGKMLWTGSVGGRDDDSIDAIVAGNDGEVYITGGFHGTINLNTAHSRQAVLTSTNGSNDVFLAKYDPQGVLAWRRQYGGPRSDGVTALKLASNGDVVLSGLFENTAQLGTVGQPLMLTSNGKQDAFIARVDATGKTLWANSVGGRFDDYITAIATENNGEVYATGSFHGIIKFNTDNSEHAELASKTNANDVFLSKYDSQGVLTWRRQYGGGGTDSATALKAAPNGDVFLAGVFEKTAQFGTVKQPSTLTSNGAQDAFIARIDATGKTLWAGSVGGESDDNVSAIVAGNDGDVYVTGKIRIRGDINPTKAVEMIACRGVDDTFIMRLNGGNGSPRWHRLFGEDNTAEGATAMTVDAQGGLYVGGIFTNKVQFDRGSNTFTRKSQGANDSYFGRLKPNGAWSRLNQVAADNSRPVLDLGDIEIDMSLQW